jgi:hypothetical protein
MAACTPKPLSISAVFLDDGHPTVIFHPCKGTVYEVTVSVDSPASPPPTATATDAATGGSGRKHWSAFDRSASSPVEQVRLLETPPGWEPTTYKIEATLTGFEEDQSYYLWVSTTKPGAGNDYGVKFTLADLRSLKDGQVWAEPKAFADPRAMSRDEFHRFAKAQC